ncbi:MAG: hypothetical protein H0U28_03415 [Nocardioidaceae bacterium]|nr:hypothetical protein [Nocardioidaceae bacterium]
MRSVRHLGVATAAAALALSLTACSDGESDGGSGSAGPVTIEVSVQGGEISPSGETVEAATGQEVELLVSSDIEDEFHLHSEPEQVFDVKAAEDQRFSFSIDSPGTYEMESHHHEVVIVKLQVD